MPTVPQKELFRRTIESLEASCRTHPDNHKLLQQLALAYYKAGVFHQRALDVYNIVSELAPGDVTIQRAVSIGYMIDQGRELVQDAKSVEQIDSDRLGRSIQQLTKLKTTYPDSAEIHRAIADLMLVRGEYREALHNYRAALALGIEELEPVCQHFESLNRLFPLPPNVMVFFAELYQRMGNVPRAQKLYQRLLDEGEVDRPTLQAYSQFLAGLLNGQTGNLDNLAETTRQLCTVLLMLEKPNDALVWARRLSVDAISVEPRLVKQLGRVLIDQEDYRQAFDYLSKIKLDHEAKALLNEIAVLLEKRGEIDTAVYLLQFINEHDSISGRQSGEMPKPDEPRSHDNRRGGTDWEIEVTTELQLAELHWKNRRWKQAFECYLKVLELGYDEYRLLLEPIDSLMERLPDISEQQLATLANFFAERRDWRRTLYYAERALFLDPGLEDIRQRLIQACEQILLQDPESCEVRLKLGEVYLDRGNIERAMKEFRKAATYPEFTMKANRRMAMAMFRAGDLKASFQKYQSLPVLETEDLEQLYDLMISFQNAEQWKLALEAATLIKDFDPNFRDLEAKIGLYERRVSEAGNELAIDARMRELIGDHSIGRYRYVEKIGSGGMGVVHKVMDLKSNTIVAMKILREGLSGSDKAIDRFFREARIAATLHHGNIVNIIDYNISNTYGQSYIAMEFVDGPSMRDIVEDKFSQTVEIDDDYVRRILDLSIQLCRALEATHRKGIIHRDIKPDNIMIAPGDVVKVTDFGIVHIEEATFTPTGALIGTPRYMSPEQVHGGRIDARSDIYSVGIIIYEMLIGSPPFISGDISYQQVNVLPTPPREIVPLVPEDVNLIVMKCLEKNPGDRFQSAAELRDSLEHAYVRMGGSPRPMPEAPPKGGSARPPAPEDPRAQRVYPRRDVVPASAPFNADPAPKPAPRAASARDILDDLDLDGDSSIGAPTQVSPRTPDRPITTGMQELDNDFDVESFRSTLGRESEEEVRLPSELDSATADVAPKLPPPASSRASMARMVGFDIPSLDDDLDYEPPPADPDPTPTARPLPSPTDIREHPMWQTNFAGDIPSPKPVRKPQAAPSNADDLDELD